MDTVQVGVRQLFSFEVSSEARYQTGLELVLVPIKKAERNVRNVTGAHAKCHLATKFDESLPSHERVINHAT